MESSSDVTVKEEDDVTVGWSAENQDDNWLDVDDGISSPPIDNSKLVQLPSEYAYPVGCPIWYNFSASSSDSTSDLEFCTGVIASVLMDDARKLVYKVGRKYAITAAKEDLSNGSFDTVREHCIAFASDCSVRLRMDQVDIDGKVVRANPVFNANGKIKAINYTIILQLEGNMCKILHGISAEKIRYGHTVTVTNMAGLSTVHNHISSEGDGESSDASAASQEAAAPVCRKQLKASATIDQTRPNNVDASKVLLSQKHSKEKSKNESERKMRATSGSHTNSSEGLTSTNNITIKQSIASKVDEKLAAHADAFYDRLCLVKTSQKTDSVDVAHDRKVATKELWPALKFDSYKELIDQICMIKGIKTGRLLGQMTGEWMHLRRVHKVIQDLKSHGICYLLGKGGSLALVPKTMIDNGKESSVEIDDVTIFNFFGHLPEMEQAEGYCGTEKFQSTFKLVLKRMETSLMEDKWSDDETVAHRQQVSSNQLQSTEGDNPTRRTSSRVRGKSSCTETKVEQNDHSDSNCDDGNEERDSERECEKSENKVSHSEQLEEEKPKCRIPLRVKRNHSYAEEDSDQEHHSESSCEDANEKEGSAGKASSAEQIRCRKPSNKRLVNSSTRASSRTRGKPRYVGHDSEQEDHSENNCKNGNEESEGEASNAELTGSRKWDIKHLASSSTRASSRARGKPSYVDKGSEQEDFSESSSEYGNETEKSGGKVFNVEQIDCRRPSNKRLVNGSTRASSRASGKPSYVDKGSEQDDYSESSSKDVYENEESEHGAEQIGRGKQSNKRLTNSSTRASSKIRGKPSYMENDSDQEDCSESSSEDEENEDEICYVEHTGRSKRKSNRLTSGSPGRKKRKLAPGNKKDPHNFPDLAKWPPVSRRKIPSIGAAVLSKLREIDDLNLFSFPICEQYPEMEDEYLQKVEIPMDFTTIEDELSHYDHIAQMQEDLILILRNCCTFNGVGHEYSSYTVGICKRLNDTFLEVCDDMKLVGVKKLCNW